MTVTPRPANQAYCHAIMQACGPTYSAATRLFCGEDKNKIRVLYAFLREPDDIVDELEDETLKRAKLARWREDWAEAWKNPDAALNPVLRESSILFHSHGITWEDTEVFLNAMQRDLGPIMWPTWAELKAYMYGSAGVVGVMMTKLLLPQSAWSQPGVIEKAKMMGDGMQLANFVRDIDEDYTQRGRIYIPKEVAETYGVTEQDLRQKTNREAWKSLVKELVDTADGWMHESASGLEVFSPRVRWSLGYGNRLYREYMQIVRRKHYDVWGPRVRLSKARKLWLLCKHSWS